MRSHKKAREPASPSSNHSQGFNPCLLRHEREQQGEPEAGLEAVGAARQWALAGAPPPGGLLRPARQV